MHNFSREELEQYAKALLAHLHLTPVQASVAIGVEGWILGLYPESKYVRRNVPATWHGLPVDIHDIDHAVAY